MRGATPEGRCGLLNKKQRWDTALASDRTHALL